MGLSRVTIWMSHLVEQHSGTWALLLRQCLWPNQGLYNKTGLKTSVCASFDLGRCLHDLLHLVTGNSVSNWNAKIICTRSANSQQNNESECQMIPTDDSKPIHTFQKQPRILVTQLNDNDDQVKTIGMWMKTSQTITSHWRDGWETISNEMSKWRKHAT